MTLWTAAATLTNNARALALPGWPAVTLTTLVASQVAIFAAALVQGTVGFGFAILSVPLMALLDPRLAPTPQLLLAAPLTFSMWWRERGATDWRGIGWVLAGRIPGVALGIAALKLASPWTLQLLVALCVLGSAVVLSMSRRPTAAIEGDSREEAAPAKRPPRLAQLSAGCASATFAVISSIGGPPLALLYRDARAETLRASLATVFSIGVLITIGARLVADAMGVADLQTALWLLPALAAGLAASRPLIRYLGPQASLRTPVLWVSALAAGGLLLRLVFA